MSSFNQRSCFGCGGPLDGLLCRRCTCEWCGNNLINGFCSICDSEAGNSFVYDPNPNFFNDPPNFFNHPPQPQTYSCELCGNDSYYGFDFPPRIPLYCGGPHESFQCQPRNHNFYEPNLCYNSNSSGFDQPPQYSIDHQPQSIQEDLNQHRMNDMHNVWIESRNELIKTMQSLGKMLRQKEQAANLSTYTPEPSRCFNFIYYNDDDDDEESTIPLNEIISQIPPSIAITPVLPTRESEDTSDSDKECDFPFCDNSVTFSDCPRL
ncbi:hypothetical protein Tco_1510646 [Tanacetum coccineum]